MRTLPLGLPMLDDTSSVVDLVDRIDGEDLVELPADELPKLGRTPAAMTSEL